MTYLFIKIRSRHPTGYRIQFVFEIGQKTETFYFLILHNYICCLTVAVYEIMNKRLFYLYYNSKQHFNKKFTKQFVFSFYSNNTFEIKLIKQSQLLQTTFFLTVFLLKATAICNSTTK